MLGHRSAAGARHVFPLAPAQFLEQVKGFRIAHVEQPLQGERPGFGGEVEVLGHIGHLFATFVHQVYIKMYANQLKTDSICVLLGYIYIYKIHLY